ncbi:MAG: hypothetical protein ACI8RZ_003982 [Myxococcota bacterium]|jgi:hypothetical protein
MMTRRGVIAGLSVLPFAPALAADPLFATLDAVGPLAAEAFSPARALDALHALHALGEAGARSALSQYATGRLDPPEGLFVVVRCLFAVPLDTTPVADWPDAIQPGHLRPPALGAPHPPQPTDLTTTPHFPALLVGDVPLSMVSGYALGGQAEPLSMHLDALAGAAWRTDPFRPRPDAEVRTLLASWRDTPQGPLLATQLDRLSPG